jgi:hypothetical protein
MRSASLTSSIKYGGVPKSFRTGSINKYALTIINIHWEATQRVMAAKLTRLTHKIATQLHLVAESCIIRSSRSRRPVRKLLDIPSYTNITGWNLNRDVLRYVISSVQLIHLPYVRILAILRFVSKYLQLKFMLSDKHDNLPFTVNYIVWLWSSRNDFIARLKGCHAILS